MPLSYYDQGEKSKAKPLQGAFQFGGELSLDRPGLEQPVLGASSGAGLFIPTQFAPG